MRYEINGSVSENVDRPIEYAFEVKHLHDQAFHFVNR